MLKTSDLRRFGVLWVVVGVFVVTCLSVGAQAALFGISPKLFNKKTNEMQDSIQKVGSENKVGLNDIQLRLGKIETNLDLQAQAQAQGIAKVMMGYDRSTSNQETVGGDMYKINKNDAAFVVKIVGLVFGFLSLMIWIMSSIIFYLLKGSMATKKHLLNEISSKARYKEKLEKLEGGKNG